MPLFLCLVLLPGSGPGGFLWAGVGDCSSVGAVRRASPGCRCLSRPGVKSVSVQLTAQLGGCPQSRRVAIAVA